MTELFQNKYRIPSARLRGWDYAAPGAYFVTICTHNRVCWFGDVHRAKMVLSEIGEIANEYWRNIPNHFENVQLGEYVVMPNHVHGIVILTEINGQGDGRDVACNVSTTDPTNTTDSTNITDAMDTTGRANEKTKNMSKISPKSKSLSTIMRSYKSAVKKWAGENKHPRFRWQTRFHDHIIRNENEFYRIADYIRNNPAKWAEDRYHPDNDLGG